MIESQNAVHSQIVKNNSSKFVLSWTFLVFNDMFQILSSGLTWYVKHEFKSVASQQVKPSWWTMLTLK